MRNHKTMIATFILILWGVAFCSVGFAENKKEFIPGEDAGFFYTIKKGDTLWDLSEKFYNSQWDWPGLWEMNDDIKNPHWIYPGQKIQIFLKGKAPREPIVVKVSKKAPPVKIEASFSFSGMDHIGFIRKEAHPSLGSIIKEEEGNIMMSANDIVYLKTSGKGAVTPGNVYHIYTPSKVEEKINDKAFKGVKHLINAEIKILEDKGTYATGLITNAYRAVNKGDQVMEYYKRDSILTVEESPDPIDARIICSEDNNVMINDYRIAFIDTGKTKVKPGQIYSVLRLNEAKDYTLWRPAKNESIKLENLASGKLIVLHTEDTTSTVMILSSKYVIQTDDIVN